jgi:hypothetical protein
MGLPHSSTSRQCGNVVGSDRDSHLGMAANRKGMHMTQLNINVYASDIDVPCPLLLNEDRYAPQHVVKVPYDFPCYANRSNHTIRLDSLLDWLVTNALEATDDTTS